MNTSNPYDGERIAGTVGFPLPDDRDPRGHGSPESGAELAADEVGMIEVRGPNVFKGYWRMPEKTAAEIRPTASSSRATSARSTRRGYVHIVGRGKDLIITGGFNVYPKEVESGDRPRSRAIVESAVIGVPHPDLGEGVTAVVVADKAAGAELDETAILASAGNRSPRQVQAAQEDRSSSTTCRAIPWARCRRTCCGRRTRTYSRRRIRARSDGLSRPGTPRPRGHFVATCRSEVVSPCSNHSVARR